MRTPHSSFPIVASWIPHPLERIHLVVERSDRFHAQAVNSHRSPFPPTIPVFPCADEPP